MPGNLNDSNQNTLLGLSNSFQDNKDLENANSISRRFISYRPRSEAELRIRLLKVFSHEIVLESVAQMYREGLLNDQRFAQMWVDSRQQSRPKSKKSIKRELLSKGISEHLAEEAISQLSDIDNATLCANKKARSLNGLGKDDFYKKLEGYLQRRGFNFSISRTVISEAWDLNQSSFQNTADAINL